MENVRETENMVRADINGCHMRLIFKEQPVEDVLEKIQAVLSSAYDDRVLKDLGTIAGLEVGDTFAA